MLPNQDKLLTVKQVASRLRVSTGAIRYWIRNGHLEAVNVRPNSTRPWYRIKTSTIENLIKSGVDTRESTN